MTEQFYITTPLYYVNDEPHIGHAYTTILADVLARYQRHFGLEVHFLTGLDEHGQKVARAAAKAGLDPQEHCDRMSRVWTAVWEKLGIQYDDFIRTTEPRHLKVVTDILKAIYDKGDIYEKEYEGWYSVYEERFFTEKDLVEDKDPIGGRPVERLTERNYFFRMSKYQDWLIEYYRSHPDGVMPSFRLNEVLGFLRQPLEDLCISRPKSRLAWGIPIPWDDDYVTYVWFDALLNYYTATVSPPPGAHPRWPAGYHLIGKDILTTHAVYWPIMLHAAGLEPPRHILAHGWWLARDEAKMSKSSGNVTKPLELADKYGADALRYFLMREMTLGQDAAFGEELFIQRYNTDLANDLGNLFSRLAKVWERYDWKSDWSAQSVSPPISGELRTRARDLETNIRRSVEQLRPDEALKEIAAVVKELNKLVDVLKPWTENSRNKAETYFGLDFAVKTLYLCARMLEPVMPEKMALLKSWIKPDGSVLSPQPGGHLFPRIQDKPIQQTGQATRGEKPRLQATSATQQETVEGGKKPKMEPKSEIPSSKSELSIEEFAKLDIRTARVLEVSRHPNADKLLLLKVDDGEGTRQVVAGLAGHYSPEELEGRTIIILANLKPVKLRGEPSEGMLLAATDPTSRAVRVLGVDGEVAPGAKVS